MSPTPSGLVATPPPSSGLFSAHFFSCCALIFLLRIHGGSFRTGSASDPSINGANLASTTQSIVAVVQYRLGGVRFCFFITLVPLLTRAQLGFMDPDGETNLAVNDVINALKVLNAGVSMIGGSRSRITIAGQSSGATMVRALLAIPSASSLFASAILQSDPMVILSRAYPAIVCLSPSIQDNGFLSPGVQQTMQNFFNEQLPCNPSDSGCASSLAVDDILEASNTLFSQAVFLNPAAGQGEPIRPVHDGQLITTTLTTSSPFPQVSKPILVTTVVDEAGPTIYQMFTSPVPAQVSAQILYGLLGSPRADTVLASQRYTAQTSGDVRPSLEKLGTDYMWKCPSWTFSRTWASSGGPAYVGMYVIGATYPTNAGIPFCTSNGSVCHQDDIQIVVSLGRRA